MGISILRDAFDADHGYQYRVSFKPHISATDLDDEVHARIAVQASLSVSENGELADVMFILPKPCRSETALTFIRRQTEARVSPPEVLLEIPGLNGDSMADAVASLDLDVAGRIIGMEIHWMPDIAST